MPAGESVEKLAGSLATVAVASLGGPLAGAGAALMEIVSYVQLRRQATGPERELEKRVRGAITAWASSQGLGGDGVFVPGIDLAASTLAQHGASSEEIAALGYDAATTTSRVIARARGQVSLWKEEGPSVVAQRCIKETYAVLISQLRAAEPTLLPAIQALRHEIADRLDRLQQQGQRAGQGLDALTASLVDAATVEEIKTYLRTRIADWDAPGRFTTWRTPSTIEQRLRLRETSSTFTSGAGDLSAAEALAGQRMLVVLGSPGAGKSWLARRYAREAAQTALDALEGGASLEEVELPLLTRWQLWDHRQEVREGLIAAGFAAQLGHSAIGSRDAVERVRRTFQCHQRVLVVIDALDEAADQADQATSLRALTSLEGWRAVITSRPAAWEATRTGAPPGPNSSAPRVGELRPLGYPDNVEAFVRTWFSAKPERGAHLLGQLRERPELRRAATIPLILTFYCILTEESTSSTEQLPARRRDLYDRLVLKLLRGAWTPGGPGPDAVPDPRQCLDTLKTWAWHGVGHSNTVTGLGNWGETFAQPDAPPPGQARAVDHIMPKQAEEDFTVTRGFVHRTVLEHLVAEHVADQDTDRALEMLLPHLWFDPDWQIAAPAAIAEHNRRHRGELLEKLLITTQSASTDFAHDMADDEINTLLLSIATESEPEEWTTQHQHLIDTCRVRMATDAPQQIADTTHWTHSQHVVREVVLKAILRGHRMWGVGDLVKALPALVTSEGERERACEVVLKALSEASVQDVGDLVKALPALEPSGGQRERAREAVLKALPGSDPRDVGGLVGVLLELEPSGGQRERAREAVLKALPGSDPRDVGGLVGVLLELEPSGGQRERAREAVLKATSRSHLIDVKGLVGVLPALVTNEGERELAREAVLNALLGANSRAVEALVRALPELEPSGGQRERARQAVLDALPGADPLAVAGLVGVLLELEPSEGERELAREAVLEALPGGNRRDIEALVGVLPGLEPSEGQREMAREAALDAFFRNDRWGVRGLVRVLSRLEPSGGQRERAREAALKDASRGDLFDVKDLVGVLPALVTNEGERELAREAVLNALLGANSRAVEALVRALPELEPSGGQRERARQAVLDALPGADPLAVAGLVGVLLELEPSEGERELAREAVLEALAQADYWSYENVVEVLREISSPQDWCEWVTSSPPPV